MNKSNANASPPRANNVPPPYPGNVSGYGQPYAAGGLQ